MVEIVLRFISSMYYKIWEIKVKLVIIVLKLLQSEAIVTCANRINNVPQGSLCCIYLDFSGMNHKHIIFLYQMDDVQENCSF